MRLVFQREVPADIRQIIDHYIAVAGTSLAEDFLADLEKALTRIVDAPHSYALHGTSTRRANLDRFPYNILFRIIRDEIQILVVRHNSRHPSVGTTRR